MQIRKWNDNTREYDFVEIPDDWKIPLYSNDMSEPINCVNCGCDMTYGEGYTSKRYHTAAGFGFYECEKCYYEYLPIYFEFKKKEAEEYEALAAQRRAKMCKSTILSGYCPDDCERCAWSEIPYQKHKNC